MVKPTGLLTVMASAWITIFTVTCAGLTVIDLVTGFLFWSQRTTEKGWLKPGALTASVSTRTTAWMPAIWVFGPSMRTLAGATEVAAVSSWYPGARALTRSIETGMFVVPSSSIATVTKLGATMVIVGSELLTRMGTSFFPTWAPEKFPVMCSMPGLTRRRASNERMWSVVPIAVRVTCGTSPTSTSPAGNTGASILRLYLWSWVGFCA